MGWMYTKYQKIFVVSVIFFGVWITTKVAAAPVQIVDDQQHTLQLPTPARRVVSLAPHLTEMMYAIGAGDALLAVDRSSDFPPPATTLPKLDIARGLPLERLISLRPELVLVWTPIAHAAEPRLATFGIAVFHSRPERLDDVATTLERLGLLTGHRQAGAVAAASFRHRLEALRARYRVRTPLRVFYRIWHQPWMTINDAGWMGEAFTLCGLVNVYGKSATPAPVIGPEALLAARPEAILAADGMPVDAPPAAGWWPSLQVYPVDPDLLHRPGPRLIEGIGQLCATGDAARASRVRP